MASVRDHSTFHPRRGRQSLAARRGGNGHRCHDRGRDLRPHRPGGRTGQERVSRSPGDRGPGAQGFGGGAAGAQTPERWSDHPQQARDAPARAPLVRVPRSGDAPPLHQEGEGPLVAWPTCRTGCGQARTGWPKSPTPLPPPARRRFHQPPPSPPAGHLRSLVHMNKTGLSGLVELILDHLGQVGEQGGALTAIGRAVHDSQGFRLEIGQ